MAFLVCTLLAALKSRRCTIWPAGCMDRTVLGGKLAFSRRPANSPMASESVNTTGTTKMEPCGSHTLTWPPKIDDDFGSTPSCV